MNQNPPTAEDLTEDNAIGTADTSDAALANQFTHPGYIFKGQPLRPYTAGTDLLFNQVLDRNDAPLTIFLSFIFIHLAERPVAAGVSPASSRPAADTAASTGIRSDLFSLCWDKIRFREALFAWIDSLGQLSNEDRAQAMNLFEEIRGWARKSSVEVVDAPKKKTKATRRPRSPAS